MTTHAKLVAALAALAGALLLPAFAAAAPIPLIIPAIPGAATLPGVARQRAVVRSQIGLLGGKDDRLIGPHA